MKISTTKTLPSTTELAEILQQDFAGRFSCKLYGLGKDKTIVVNESTFVGAQISISNNEITIQGMPAPIIPLISMTELAAVLIFFLGWFFRKPWVKLEKEIAVYLHHKYN